MLLQRDRCTVRESSGLDLPNASANKANGLTQKPYNTAVRPLSGEVLRTEDDRVLAMRRRVPGRPLRWAALLSMLITAGVFLALHFLHLRADFPNLSPWSDWAKYTDEGWYGDAAIRHYLRGTWHLPGDFNPAAALPVWPMLEALLFRFTGVGIVAARALTVVVFIGIVTCGVLLLRRRLPTWSRCRAGTLPCAPPLPRC